MSRPHHILLPNPQHRRRSRSPGRSSTSPTRRNHRQCPITPITSSPLNPNPSPRSNMMMYNPYQWGGGMGGQGAGYPGMQNPYMMGRDPSVMGSMPAPSQSSGTEDKNLRPFDSTKMKQGRLGHYGYLEGRGECVWRNKLLTKYKTELAGPPVGHLPAGMQSQYSQAGHGTTTAGPSSASYQGNGSWGDLANIPRARYDGGVYFLFWVGVVRSIS